MSLKFDTQRTSEFSVVDDFLLTWIEAFLIDRKTNGVAAGTLYFYRIKLLMLADYCETNTIKQITQVSPTFIRQFLLHLEENGHNPGGKHAIYRALRVFFLWYEEEAEPSGWSNPIRKVKAPKLPTEPLEPVSIENVSRMIKGCEQGTFAGDRDTAILLCLIDTGARANEFLDMDLDDINQARGDILIRQGKGSKPRQVYLGDKSRRALRKYLKHRKDDYPALWVTLPRFNSGRMKYDGLRAVLSRRASDANIDVPSPHDFRRAFALSMLRNETDLYTLAKLMGMKG